MSVQCPNCKANNPANSIFCAECGTDLRTVQSPTPQSTASSSQSPVPAPQPYNFGNTPQPANTPPNPSQPTYVYGGQSQPSNTPVGPSQSPNIYGNQPQSPSFGPGPAPQPYNFGNQQPPNTPPGPAQPTYVYGNQQQPQPNNFVSPSLPPYNYNNPQQPPNPPYTPPNSPVLINNSLGRPNTGPNVPLSTYPQPNQYPMTTQQRRGNPGLIIGAVVVVLALIGGGIFLATQGKPDTHGTPTPGNQTLLTSPTVGGKATQAPSTVDLLNPGVGTAPASGTTAAGQATTAPATTAPATTAPATHKPTVTHAPAPTATANVNYKTIRGPENFQLDHQVGKPTVKGFSDALDLADFYAGAVFTNPYDAATAGAGWDYGFVFRDSSGGDAFIIVVTSASDWELDRLDSKTNNYVTISSGKLTNLKVGDGDTNTLEILAQGNKLVVAVNGQNQPNTLDLSSFSGSGDVEVITGFFKGNKLDGESTAVNDFTVQVKS